MESLVDHLTSNNSNELPKAYQLVKYLTPKHLKKVKIIDISYHAIYAISG